MFNEWKKELNEAEKAILNYTYSYWKENLEWPKNVDVELKCRNKFKNNDDLYSVADQLRYNFINYGNPNQENSVTELTIFGIALCDNSDKDIDLFLKIMKQYVEDFIRDPSTNSQINVKNFDSDKHCKKVCYLLNAAGFDLFSSIRSNCNFTLKTDIWKFEHVKTIEDYYNKIRNNPPERFSKSDESIETKQNKIEGIRLKTSEKNNVCFVVSPIGEKGSKDYEKFKKVLDLIIKPAVEFSGYRLEVLRADEIKKPGSWINDILNNLFSSFIVIADLTDQNPNVFYELGVRHSLSPRTILIAQSIEDIPSDLRSYRTIVYEMSLEGPHKFKEELSEYLEEIFQDPNRLDNPVLDNLGTIKENLISKLESENVKLRKEIKKKDPNLLKIDEEISEENIHTRLDRIFKIEKIKRSYISLTYDYLINEQGNFHSYEDDRKWFYIAKCGNDYKKENYRRDISDIRVLMDMASELTINPHVTCVIATNADLSNEKKNIYNLFNKSKTFVKEEARDFFKLEIWDKNVILKKERELGIRFD